MMRNARKKIRPFTVVHDPALILDYGRMFTDSDALLPKMKTFKIRSYVRFHFKNGILSAYQTYAPLGVQLFQVIKRVSVGTTFREQRPAKPGLKAGKAKDVLSLLPYVQNETGAAFLRTVTEQYVPK